MDETTYKPELEEEKRLPFGGLLVAGQFLTIMPPLLKRPFTDRELGDAVAYFPLVGLGLGLVIAGADELLALVFPASVRLALLLALWVVLTGVLHLDGFLDACDGLFGGFTPEQRLEIMRDERVGAYALAGGVLLLLLKFVALTAVSHLTLALFLAPLLGRWAISLALVGFPYGRAQGLGRTMKDQAGSRQRLLATLLALAAALLIGRWLGLLAMVAVALLVWLGGRFVMKRIPGLTGDVYGALCELGELVVLLVLVAGGGL